MRPDAPAAAMRPRVLKEGGFVFRQVDKQLHFFVSFALVAAFSLFMPLLQSAVLTLGIGAAKEAFWDRHFCKKDMLANTIGVVLYVFLHFASAM